jgi:tRNA A-37 threonylcarbamoyl transferase component Bud32
MLVVDLLGHESYIHCTTDIHVRVKLDGCSTSPPLRDTSPVANPQPKLVASGRAADVFEHGPGTVIRRYRHPDADVTREAAVMEHLRLRGYPVPAVHFASGPELAMDRIEGPTMLEDLTRRPWRLWLHARLLAELHERLHAIEARPGLEAPFGDGGSVLHLDLHPGNVILTSGGPVVIDWSNVMRGDPAVDVAQTWVLLATSLVPGNPLVRAVGAAGRGIFVRAFLQHLDRDAAAGVLAAVAERRLRDPNVLPEEAAALRRLAT